MKIITEPFKIEEIWNVKESGFGEMLKAVIDVDKGILAVDAELHSDLEALLLENGSAQTHLWGLNLYPLKDKTDTDFIEFTSYINIRPSQNNRSMDILDHGLREKITSIIRHLIV